MGKPDLNRNHTNPHLSSPYPAEPKSDSDVKIELSTELIMQLRNNAYDGTETNDAVDHITRFLQIIDLVKAPNVNIEQLRVLTFPYSLTGEAHRWWVHDGNSEITSRVEIVDKFFYKYHPLSHASKANDANVRECHLKFMSWLSSKFKIPWKLSCATKNALWNYWEKGYDNDMLIYDNESSDEESNNSNHRPSFEPYQNDDNKGNKSNQTIHNHDSNTPENSDAPHSFNNEQNKGICRVDKFEVIKYSVGNNEEFLSARMIECDSLGS
ncbi:hypothetical protein Tco_0815371 [Tanacetum coccineum]